MPSAAGVVVQEPLGSGVMPDVRFVVYGTPAPKGSKSPKRRTSAGRVILVESSPLVKPWIEAIKWTARAERIGMVRGPVRVRTVFTLRKPVSAPKRRVTYPDRAPDLDKLTRCVADALTQAGVIEDDGRIVCLSSCKAYPGEHADALNVPGVLIEVSQVKP